MSGEQESFVGIISPLDIEEDLEWIGHLEVEDNLVGEMKDEDTTLAEAEEE